MGIEDDIRKGAEEERRQKEHEQRQQAEQARQAEQRAAHAAGLWPYLERYREAVRAERGPTTIECTKPRLFRDGNKVFSRSAWLVSRHSGGVDNIGQQVVFRVWLDDTQPDVWWQQAGFPARRINLGENNPGLSADENQALEEAEKALARNLGKVAARDGIVLAPSG